MISHRPFHVLVPFALASLALLLPLAATAPAQVAADPQEPQAFFLGPSEGPAPVPAICFLEGTSESYVADVKARLAVEHGWNLDAKYFLGNAWPGSVQGDNLPLSWSFVPDGLSMEGDTSDLFARMNTLFGGDQALWISKFQDVFDRWEELCGIDFTRVTAAGVEWDDGASWGQSGNDTTRGDIRIGMINIDGGGGTLGFTYFPGSGIGGNMALDTSESWASGAANNYRLLRNTVSHELGHAMGFDHVCPINSTKLMEPFVSTSYNGPRHDDVRAAHRHYGDDAEGDNTSATAFDLGVLNGTELSLGAITGPVLSNTSTLSIDANGEQDWYRFTANSGPNLTFTLAPAGLTYTNVSEGNCGGSTTIDSSAISDLGFEVRSGPTGATILTTVDATAAGSSEGVVNLALPGTGTYFVRVFEDSAPTQTQLYTVTLRNSAFNNLGFAKTGTNGLPNLSATGLLVGGGSNSFTLSSAKPSSPATLFFSTTAINAPFKGGTLVPSAMLLTFLGTDASGNIALNFNWPTGLPVGLPLYWQYWITDTGATFNLSASNALRGVTN